jgi:uncharacterized membrane protein
MEQYVQTAPENTETSLFELQIDHEVSSHLRETAKWAKFLSIVGFVFIGLILVFVLFAGTMISSYSSSSVIGAALGSGGMVQIVLLLAMIALYFFPCLFTFNFSNRMLRALRDSDQYTLIASFRQLKLCYKFVGILTLVFISLYVLILVWTIILAITR